MPTVSSEELAAAAGVNSAKLRKDFSYLGSYGTRGVGYDVEYLVYQISRELGLTQDWPVVIVGIGNLGAALANYGGFASRGFRVAALIDADPAMAGKPVAGIPVQHTDELEAIIRDNGVSIGVIATPAGAAQQVCDRLVAAGVTSILNFAPTVLTVPDGVDVRKVDLSIELQILAFHEQRKAGRGGRGRGRRRPGRRSRPHRRRRRARGLRHRPGARRGRTRRDAGMSLLVVGLSHRSAPVSVLERASLSADAQTKLLQDTVAAEPASEGAVLATCNRIELYADVDKFHAGVAELSTLLAQHSGVGLEELTPYLYVHYEDRAVHHLFSVACGLDSMVVGEGQILGQIKDSLARAQETHTAGRLLNDLFQQALRVGKRAHPRPASTAPGSPWSPSAWSSSRSAPRRDLGAGQEGPGHRRRFDVLAVRGHARARRDRRGRGGEPHARPRRTAGADPHRGRRHGRGGPRGPDGIGAVRADTCRCGRLLHRRDRPGPHRRDDRRRRRGPPRRGTGRRPRRGRRGGRPRAPPRSLLPRTAARWTCPRSGPASP